MAIAENTGMKLAVKTPARETTTTNSSGPVRKGNVENPTASASSETRMIRPPFPVLSRRPPQRGEKTMVSMAGIRETREISEKEAFNE